MIWDIISVEVIMINTEIVLFFPYLPISKYNKFFWGVENIKDFIDSDIFLKLFHYRKFKMRYFPPFS